MSIDVPPVWCRRSIRAVLAEELDEGQQLVSDHHIILRPCDHVCQTATVPTDQEISILSSMPLRYAHIV